MNSRHVTEEATILEIPTDLNRVSLNKSLFLLAKRLGKEQASNTEMSLHNYYNRGNRSHKICLFIVRYVLI
jgi:hypothetical protein